jgi:glucans biosynthesis protein
VSPGLRGRQWGLVALALVIGSASPSSAVTVAGFGFEEVVGLAEKRAATEYKPPERVPDWLLQIGYDQWRDIRFRPEESLWRKVGPFEVQFFHPGLYYDRAVKMNVVDSTGVHPVAFSPSLFDYGKNDFASRVPQNLGFAGFRLHYPIKTPKYRDEVIVFLGASYFRAVGRDQGFGLSARGLAIDTAESSGEEFPFFDEFWLVRPSPRAREMTLLALLDSPGIVGAYRFVVRPGVQTIVDVDVKLFARRPIGKLGIAPLTSMFYSGENDRPPREDYRPEVHDSDGLQVETGTGEWIWRPLVNPERLRVTSFRAEELRGFGVIQRDRNFENYQDLETRQELRPSVWITPRGAPWGAGRVELVEIPTTQDINDNMVVYWVGDEQIGPGKKPDISYRMSWFGSDARMPPAGRVVATRWDTGTKEGAYRFVVDFDGDALRKLPAETVVRGVVTVGSGDSQGEVLEQQVQKNPTTGGWRLAFQARPAGDGPFELRAYLDLEGSALTETWTYLKEP